MDTSKPETRTGADKPEETKHLSSTEKRALEKQGEAEHADGEQREKLTPKTTKEK